MSLKLQDFENEIKNKNYYVLFFTIVNLDDEDFLIAFIFEIRYILIFLKIKNMDKKNFSIELNNKIKKLLFNNKIKIVLNKDYELIKTLNIGDSSIPNYSTINQIINRNLRSLSELKKNKNIFVNDLVYKFNNKTIKTLSKKSPQYWLERLDYIYSFNKNEFKYKTSENFKDKNIKIIPPNYEKKDVFNSEKAEFNNLDFEYLNKEDLEIYVKKNYNFDWYKFFFELKKSFYFQIESAKKINNKLDYINKSLNDNYELTLNNYNILKSNYENLNANYKSLQENSEVIKKNNEELKEKLNFVKEEIELQKNKRIEKENRAKKIKNAKKQPQRDYIEYEEFNYLLNYLDDGNILNYRRKCAFLLLYITGLRISNLLIFKITNIKELIFKGYTRIDLIKKGEVEHLITLSKHSKKLVNDNYHCFNLLFKYKEDDDYFFTSLSNPQKPINKSNFNKELNGVLKKVSKKFNKNIKSHSFRATYITDLLQAAPLHVVKDIVGHKVVASTEIYYRSSLTHKDSLSILNKADEYKLEKLNIN